MRMDLGMDDKTLLDLASQPWTPRTTRQRSANPSAHGSTKLGALATTDDIAEMRLDGGETFGDDEDEEEEDEEEDSASVYQDSASVSPQPSRPSASHANISSSNLARTTASSKASARGYPSSHLEATPSSVSLAKSSDASSTLTTTTNKRGRKPAPAASRGAREQARKTNHSKIEKRRREKINEALSTLREMVPVGIAGILEQHDLASPGASPALSAVGAATVVGVGSPIIPGGGKKKGGEKEFKLEVLERTVIFVKYLLDRVNELEAQADANPKSPDTNLTIPTNTPFAMALPSPLLPPTPSSPQQRKRRRNDPLQSSADLPTGSTSTNMPNEQLATAEFNDRSSKRSKRSSGGTLLDATSGITANNVIIDPSLIPDKNRGLHRNSNASNPAFCMTDVDMDNSHLIDTGDTNTNGILVDDSQSAPLSPTTTLVNSTPYMDASVWHMSEPQLASPASKGKKSSVVGTSDGQRNAGRGKPSSPIINMNGSRPRLPSIAAMLNPSNEVLSPSMLPSNMSHHSAGSGSGSSSSPLASSLSLSPRSDELPAFGASESKVTANTTPSSSSLTSSKPPGPFQLPSSSLPISGTSTSTRLLPSTIHGTTNTTFPKSKQRDIGPSHHPGMHREGRGVEDDETAAAATLLMHFSYERDRDRGTNNIDDPTLSMNGVRLEAHTPGSILGLEHH